ncbi:unnamed protein product [Lactuca virosa]|uniref:Uncharacterized protein n=1 Tax=Lactuca virosa TaxID=75947 RepID=A0AAU9MVL2_9ASTR|nr:unnamed protein product [Lactuca virosa]
MNEERIHQATIARRPLLMSSPCHLLTDSPITYNPPDVYSSATQLALFRFSASISVEIYLRNDKLSVQYGAETQAEILV